MQLQSADCIFCAMFVVTFSRVRFYKLHILRTSVQLCMLQSGEIRLCTILFSLVFFGVTCTLVEICATLFSWHFLMYTWFCDLRITSAGLQA